MERAGGSWQMTVGRGRLALFKVKTAFPAALLSAAGKPRPVRRFSGSHIPPGPGVNILPGADLQDGNYEHEKNTEISKGMAELETKALRSQMNPHFIFNSLNSIQKYIWENRKEDASEYLTKFARLIRLVLENSLHHSVKLTEELDALRLYIEMEHRRNNQKFDYSISVNNNVDAEAVYISPLLLQPYVENAIWHGLSEKEGRGKLSVNIERKGDALMCTIDDTGVGRKRSAETKANKIHKSSLGMNISAQRIERLQKDTGLIAAVDIADKYTEGNAAGTTVTLTLPLILKHD